MKSIIAKVFGIITALAIVVTTVIGLLHIDKSNHIEAINNPPSINYIEEELEYTFLTTDIEVSVYDDNEDYVLYIVKANGFVYKVLYRVVRGTYLSYHWEMIKYIQIKGE